MPTFRFDLLSFWIGFLAATIFWGIINFLRPRMPLIKARLSKAISNARARNLAGMEATTRREILKRAQKMHLAGNMFALDEILVEPRIIAPPAYLDKASPYENEGLVDRTIPYTPGWPELSAPYAVTTISLPEAMEKGVNIALIGEPGTGKTVALAHFASLVARRSPASGTFADYTPCLVNVLDIQLNAMDTQDPLDLLIKAITSQFPLLTQTQIPRFLRRKLNDKTFLLLLDGLDELSPVDIQKANDFIGVLLEKYPSLRIAAACSPHYLDGLLKHDFYPLSLAGWNRDDQIKFLHEWGYLWSTHISPEVRKQTTIQEIPPYFMNNWLETESMISTPFEWTIKTWLSYSGEANGFAGMGWLDAFIHRYIKDPPIRNAFEHLALRICVEGKPHLAFSDCDKFISSLNVEMTQTAVKGDASFSQREGVPAEPQPKTKEKKVSLGSRVIENLLQQKLLTEHPGEKITFMHPIITGYLASFAVREDPPEEILNNMNWPTAQLCLHYLASQTQAASWIDRLIKSEETPLLRDALIVGRWIKDAPLNAAWRSTYMRKLIGLIQTESVPLSLRARLMSVCVIANDPSISLLIKQLIMSKSFIVRRLAALAYGALPTAKSFDELLELMIDPVLEVRNAACLALAAIRNSAASEALIDILMRGDETLQQAAAESLAYRGEEGYAILKDAITSQDLMVRRAVVFGLARIRQPWAKEILDKVAVEDGQWVVRNAAVQALDDIQKTNLHIPEPLPPATQSPWLIEFAGKQGVGLRPDQPAVEMLLNALKAGTPEERVSALRYLRLTNEEGIIGAIYQVAYLEQNQVADAGMYAVWFITMSGAKMPHLAQYGVG